MIELEINFSAGPPFGGTCFPRDTYAFISFAKKIGSEAKHMRVFKHY